jgi:hypothetical protein
MILEKLAQLGWYKTEPSSPKEIADLCSIVDRLQADLKVEGISDDLRFQAAFVRYPPGIQAMEMTEYGKPGKSTRE